MIYYIIFSYLFIIGFIIADENIDSTTIQKIGVFIIAPLLLPIILGVYIGLK